MAKHMPVEAPNTRQRQLMAEYPDYCSIGEFAKLLGLSRGAARRYASEVKSMRVAGIMLFNRRSAEMFASTFKKRDDRVTWITVKGVDVTRLQLICESYYKTRYDTAPEELLTLAKRIAKL